MKKAASLAFLPCLLFLQADNPKKFFTTIPDIVQEGFLKLNAGASQAAVLPDSSQYANFNDDKTRLLAVTRAMSKPLEMPMMGMETIELAETNRGSLESMLRAVKSFSGTPLAGKPGEPGAAGGDDDDALVQVFADLEIDAGKIPDDVFRNEYKKKIAGIPKVLRRPMAQLLSAMFEASKTFTKLRNDLSDEDRNFLRTQGIKLGNPDGKLTLDEVKKLNKLYVDKVSKADTAGAALNVAMAVEKLIAAATTKIILKPGQSILFEAETPLGRVILGGKEKNEYDKDAALLIDLGGDDVYKNNAGGSKDVPGQIAVLIDTAGNDKYESKKDYVQGCGAFGIGFLVDLEGNDSYVAGDDAQGCGILGYGALIDRAGNDRYEGGALVQGAGEFGIGLLEDESGTDEYKAAFSAQGFGGPGGVGALIDRKGNDKYFAGGKYPDTARDKTKFLSMSQGFGYGLRLGGNTDKGFVLTGSVAGGVGVLLDLAGDDVYDAGIFGQGSGYWFGLGMLIDQSGNDVYKSWRYSQGAATHLAAGLLLDLSGNDNYSAWGVSQGCAHDFAVAALVDFAGNDSYKAETLAQGVSNARGAFAFLLDRAGDDSYSYTGKDKNCWGAVATGEFKAEDTPQSYGFFYDLGGKDTYKGAGKTMKDATELVDENFGLGVAVDK